MATVDAALRLAGSGATIWLKPGRHGPGSTISGRHRRRDDRSTIAATPEGQAVVAGGDAPAAIQILDTERRHPPPISRSMAPPEAAAPASCSSGAVGVRIDGLTVQGVRGGYGIEVRHSSR